MIYTKEKFKELWEANEWGSSITYDDIADCAVAWGISYNPRLGPINEIAYKVLKAAQVNDAEEYNPNPAPMKREEIGCGYCIHEEVCEQRKHRTIPTRQLARECGNFVHYQAKKAFEQGVKWADEHPRWISVEDYATDELPPLIDEKDPYGESVHVLFVVELDGIQFISKGCFDYDSGMWHALETDCSYCKENVTHWMPLPAPPKKGGEQ